MIDGVKCAKSMTSFVGMDEFRWQLIVKSILVVWYLPLKINSQNCEIFLRNESNPINGKLFYEWNENEHTVKAFFVFQGAYFHNWKILSIQLELEYKPQMWNTICLHQRGFPWFCVWKNSPMKWNPFITKRFSFFLVRKGFMSVTFK